MRNFVNIDSVERLRRAKFSLKKTIVIAGLVTGIGGAAIALGNKGSEVDNNGTSIEQESLAKVYKSYEIKSGETLTSIVNQLLQDYPDTAKFYTVESLKKEVISINNLGSGDKITSGNYLIIPYYMPTVILDEKDAARETFEEEKKAQAAGLEEYQDYVVQSGDSYWKIACLYTNDDNEIVRIVQKLQSLNGNGSLQMGETITIPNIEKYQIEHQEFDEASITR